MQDPPPPTTGLEAALFAANRSSEHRRRRAIFLVVYVLVAVGLTLPALPGVWGATPLILGLPTAFAWVILNLTIIFVALLVPFRHETDMDGESAAHRDGSEEG